jgi:hypothetical protein
MSFFSLENVVAELNTQIENEIYISQKTEFEDLTSSLKLLEENVGLLIQKTWMRILTALRTHPSGAVELATLNLFAHGQNPHESFPVYRSEIETPDSPHTHSAVKEKALEFDYTLFSGQTVPDMIEQLAKIICAYRNSFEGILIEPTRHKPKI